MTKNISPASARSKYGIVTLHELMSNGEKRFRLTDKNGIGYIRTEAGPKGGWQSSHFHRLLIETYIVQAGWIAIATLTSGGALKLLRLNEGSLWNSPKNVAHNVYMSAKSITHTVKHGAGDARDWLTSADTDLLDALTKKVTTKRLQKL